jgi:N-acetylmuramoyl-L-alanine amidase
VSDPYGGSGRDPYGDSGRDEYGDSGDDAYGSSDRGRYGGYDRDAYGSLSGDTYGGSGGDAYGGSDRGLHGDSRRDAYHGFSGDMYGGSDRARYGRSAGNSYGNAGRDAYGGSGRIPYGGHGQDSGGGSGRDPHGGSRRDPYGDSRREMRRVRAARRRWRVRTVLTVLAAGGLTAGAFLLFGSSPASPTPSVTPSASVAANQSSRPHSPTPSHPSATPQAKVLAGMIVGIDPGHNGQNFANPAIINKMIYNGREYETCDTTGTQTDAGYTEASFNFNVSKYLRADLRKDGARVVMTRYSNDGVGPCVDKRALILDHAHANVAIDIHADGGPANGRGFTVLEPVRDAKNASVVQPSLTFGSYVHQAFLNGTPFGVSDYYGQNGYIVRSDLAGLNLTTVPKVLIECGNMRNATDAALLTSPRVQREIARALEAAIIRFLTGHWPPKTTA